jgi:uncharacterized protein YjcR
MPRARDPNRDKAYEIWKESKGKKLLKNIAAELGVSDSQIRKWKSQDKWEQKNGNVTNSKRSVTKRDKQKNRSGNPNPQNQFTKRNNAARIHGLRSKYFTEAQQEIMEDFQGTTIADQLWIQIEIKFSAIVHMQKVMWVNDSNDHLREESGSSFGDGASSEQFKIAFAYERYESYIKAQTRAMAEYRNLTKQFLELASDDDIRRLKLEQMKLGIEKTKAEINKLENSDEDQQKDVAAALRGLVNGINSKAD